MAGKADIRAGRAFVELFVKGAKFEAGLRKMSNDLKAFGESAKQVGQKLAAMGVVAGTAIGAAVKRFSDFDDQMRAFAGAAEATDAELATLTDTAKRLGATTSFTAVQVASLMTELGRAGFTADEVDKMTGAVLALARATGTDATLSAGIMSATLRQFGLDASQATRVADAFTVAANKSFNTVEQLGEALNYAGPVAHDFNMSLEDTLAIFGGLGNMGIQASNAGTAVRRLLTITGAEADKLREIFGVTFIDAAGNARPLVDVLGEVHEATKGLGTAARASKFNEAFGLLGITAASAIGSTVGDIRELQAALQNAAGTADKTADRMDAGLGGSLRRLLSSIEGVAISIGNALGPALEKITAAVVKVAGNIKTWIDNNRELAVFIAGATAAVTAMGLSLVGLGTAVGIASFAMGGLATLIGIVGSAIGAIVSPAGLAVVGLTALAAASLHLYGIVPQLVAALQPLVGAIRAVAVAIGGGEFAKAWEIAATSVEYFASLAKDVFFQIPEYAAFAAGRLSREIVIAFQKTWDWVLSTTKTVFESILESAQDFGLDLAFAMMGGGFSGALTTAFGNALEKAANTISGLAIEFDAGYAGMDAPTLNTSEKTNDLRAALTKMSSKSPTDIAAGASSAMAAVGIGAMGGAASSARGLPGGGGAGAAPTGGEKPTIELSAIEKYRDRIKELSDAYAKEDITRTEFEAGIQQLRRDMLSLNDPIQEYKDRVALLDAAHRSGVISAAEYDREIEAAKANFVDATPLERYHARMKELKELFDAGIINDSQFQTAQMDALPDKVKAIIERSKTPLDKFNEQITEARDLFSQGLITPGQFAAEQERLQKELREEEKKGLGKRRPGEVAVSFSAASLIAQGMGAQGGGARDEIGGKLETQISATNRQTEILQGIRDVLEKRKATFS